MPTALKLIEAGLFFTVAHAPEPSTFTPTAAPLIAVFPITVTPARLAGVAASCTASTPMPLAATVMFTLLTVTKASPVPPTPSSVAARTPTPLRSASVPRKTFTAPLLQHAVTYTPTSHWPCP